MAVFLDLVQHPPFPEIFRVHEHAQWFWVEVGLLPDGLTILQELDFAKVALHLNFDRVVVGLLTVCKESKFSQSNLEGLVSEIGYIEIIIEFTFRAKGLDVFHSVR